MSWRGRTSRCFPATGGMPKTLLEAAACGRPIVATDVPGCRDVVRHGVNGLLVPARDARALADAITALADDPARRAAMGAEGRRRAEEGVRRRANPPGNAPGLRARLALSRAAGGVAKLRFDSAPTPPEFPSPPSAPEAAGGAPARTSPTYSWRCRVRAASAFSRARTRAPAPRRVLRPRGAHRPLPGGHPLRLACPLGFLVRGEILPGCTIVQPHHPRLALVAKLSPSTLLATATPRFDSTVTAGNGRYSPSRTGSPAAAASGTPPAGRRGRNSSPRARRSARASRTTTSVQRSRTSCTRRGPRSQPWAGRRSRGRDGIVREAGVAHGRVLRVEAGASSPSTRPLGR